jgi:hypothetical protein
MRSASAFASSPPSAPSPTAQTTAGLSATSPTKVPVGSRTDASDAGEPSPSNRPCAHEKVATARTTIPTTTAATVSGRMSVPLAMASAAVAYSHRARIRCPRLWQPRLGRGGCRQDGDSQARWSGHRAGLAQTLSVAGWHTPHLSQLRVTRSMRPVKRFRPAIWPGLRGGRSRRRSSRAAAQGRRTGHALAPATVRVLGGASARSGSSTCSSRELKARVVYARRA